MGTEDTKTIAQQQALRIAERLRTARLLKHTSQEDVARALDVTVRTYARWERGDSFGFLGELDRLAKVLDTTPEALRGDAGLDDSAVMAELSAIRARVDEVHEMLERVLGETAGG